METVPIEDAPLNDATEEEKKDREKALAVPKKKPHKKKGPFVLPEIAPTEVRLYKFLYTGREDGLYVAGVWNEKTYYIAEKITSVAEMTVDLDNAKKLVEAIKFVKQKQGGCVEPCIYALALAIKSAKSDQVKNLLYTEAVSIIASCEDLFMFIHHLSTLKTGTGKGWRRFVSTWYKFIPPQKLAIMVSGSKGGFGWTHKDILRLAHDLKVPESNVRLHAVLSYIFEGLTEADAKFGKEDLAKEVLVAIRVTEQARKCQDRDLLAVLLRENDFLGANIVAECQLAKDLGPTVWKAVLEKLPIDQVLSKVQKLHNDLLLVDYAGGYEGNPEAASLLPVLGAKGTQDLGTDLVDILNKAEWAPPILTYIVLRDYNAGRKRMSYVKATHYTKSKANKMTICLAAKGNEKGLKRWQKQSRKGELLPPRADVLEALESLLHRSLSMRPEDVRRPGRYLVTVDLRSHMFKVFQGLRTTNIEEALKNLNFVNMVPLDSVIKKYSDERNHCFWSEHVSPGKAAVLLALYFLSHVKEVTVAVFTDEGIETVSLLDEDGKILDMEKAETKLKSAQLGHVSLCSPIEWAMRQKDGYNVFVNVVRTTALTREVPKTRRAKAANPQAVLKEYQKTMGVPDAGLVNISLGRFSRIRLDYNMPRILDIFGFDEHVPSMVHEFAERAVDKL